ncbi:hypothetical protein K7X08_019810 [Anisodus acutangulus]|uniref:Uncharacterized protein n=1 Tax=Anisodus acutangulus TaxID=402998 RepID=A0A9Q1MY76_9SOLA|nr:hypothetical protein K7X08_019810 [Anisodus acutangulus]
MIRKSVETMKNKDEKEKDERRHKHRDKKSKHVRNSSPRQTSDPDEYSSEDDSRRKKEPRKDKKYNERKSSLLRDPEGDNNIDREKTKIRHGELEAVKHERQTRSYLPRHKPRDNSRGQTRSHPPRHESRDDSCGQTRSDPPRHESRHNSRKPVRLSEEERAARLREMQRDAEVHEEQRWKRFKKAEEKDAKEAVQAGSSGGRNFLDAAQRSVYGAWKEEAPQLRKAFVAEHIIHREQKLQKAMLFGDKGDKMVDKVNEVLAVFFHNESLLILYLDITVGSFGCKEVCINNWQNQDIAVTVLELYF